MKIISFVIVICLFSPDAHAIHQPGHTPSANWQVITTVEELWNEYPEKIRRILAALDLQHPGLEPVRSALDAGDMVSAARNLVTYYKTTSSSAWLGSTTYRFTTPEERLQAEQVLNNSVLWNGAVVGIPETGYGGWDWSYTGAEPDDEFGYTLNRHGFFLDLLKGWQETGKEAYAEKFDLLVRDWILHHPLPGEDAPFWDVHRTTTEELDWRDIGEVKWRDLDAGIRLGESWPQAFYGFQQAEAFTPAGRLLMLYSILVHTDYLREFHKTNHNWATMEMNGLAFAGLAFPEFKEAEQWIDYAMEIMQKEIDSGQVYPDYVQKELSTYTHGVALHRFETLVRNFRTAGREVPEEYLQRVEGMYNYLAYSLRPDGHQPLNNDSDRLNLRPLIMEAAETYNRPDWLYIATNGEKGERPRGLASRTFPWAGIHIMRNGWDKTSHWAFFDTGPYGIGHQHRDKLHLSVHAYGRDLLVDSGRYTHENYFSFDPRTWRGYFRSSFSQNVILVDESGQDAGSRTTEEPLVQGRDYLHTTELDYARGTFSDGFEKIDGKAGHTRAVVYVKDSYWVVVDRIVSDRPRHLQVLWRYAPDMHVVTEGNQVVSDDKGKGNLRIVPANSLEWELSMIQGQTEPYIQGWYSETYGKKEPNPTAVYSAYTENDETVFAWVLIPADGTVPRARAFLTDGQAVEVRIEIDGEEPVSVTVPLEEGMPEIK